MESEVAMVNILSILNNIVVVRPCLLNLLCPN